MQIGISHPAATPPSWTTYRAVSVHFRRSAWTAGYLCESGDSCAHGFNSRAAALLEAQDLAEKLKRWIVEYDKNGGVITDHRPLKVRIEFCGLWLKHFGLAKVGKALLWIVATVATTLITIQMERTLNSANNEVQSKPAVVTK